MGNFSGLVSMAMIRPALAITAPCTTDKPMPPSPNTATEGARLRTLAVFSTAPMPVVMPHPSRQTLSSGAVHSPSRPRFRAARVLRECARAHVVKHGLALGGERVVPSGMSPLPCVARIFWPRLVRPERQNLHSPHSGVYRGITWSPALTLVTPAPTSWTMPPPS